MLILTDGPIKTDTPKAKTRERQTEREGEREVWAKETPVYLPNLLSLYLYPLVVSFPSLLINRETAGVIFQVKEESSGQNLYMT